MDPQELIYVAGKRRVYAVDAHGQVCWEHRFAGLGKWTSLLVVGELLLVARHGELYALDRFDGALRWRAQTPDTRNTPPTLAWAGGAIDPAWAQAIAQAQAAAAAAAAG